MNRRTFRFGIRTKLNMLTIAVVALLAIIVYGFAIPLVEREKRGERESKLRAVVETAVSLMAYYEDAVRTYRWKTDPSLPRTRDEAQARILAYLRPLRYEKDEHIFILDSTAHMIMHPLKPDLQGRGMSEVKAPDGSQPFRDMAFEAQRMGSVFVNYIWLSKWSQTVSEPQTTFARYFYPWDWVVCSSLYTQDIDDAVRKLKRDAALVIGLGAMLAWGVLFVIASLLARPIVALARQVSFVTGHADMAAADIITVRGNDEIGDLANAFRQTLDELRQATARLRENEESLRTTLNSIGDAVIATDTYGTVTRMNPLAETLTGWRIGEARGRSIGEVFVLVNALTRVPAADPVHKVIEKGSVVGLASHTLLLCRDGTEYQIADSAAPIRNAEGVITGVVLIFRDVTEEYRIRAALAESESRFRSLVESSADLIWGVDARGVYTYISPRVRDVLGYAPEELQGKTPFDLMPADEAERVGARFRELLAAGQPIAGLENVNRHKDGRLVILETSGTPIRDGAGLVQGYCGIARDITDRKRAEAEREKLQSQLTQAQKMESVGRLAGGVAHDFNNMLQAILGNAALALQDLPPDSPVRESLEEIEKSARRSADLTRQLLAFARKQTIAPRVLALNDTVSGMLKMLRRLIGEDIDLSWMPGANLWSVKMDPSQIDQVLANLCVNARDAIGGVGTVTIETTNVTLDDTYVQSHPECVPGDYVLLAVSDTGKGMDAETRAHLFEPFFTTKEQGKGTGLGLATVFGIVKQNHGLISIYSEPGRGSTFKIYLPRAEAEAVAAVAATRKRNLSGTETVLLVEDEGQILNLAQRILQQHGYTVLAARSPEAALKLAAAHPETIHLLITDVVMPGMNGRELHKRLVALKPGLRCLYMSGYTANVIAHHGVLDEGVQFLQKPFTIESLAEGVREAVVSKYSNLR